MKSFQTTMNLHTEWLVWCYIPNEEATGWLEPHICEDEATDKASAHQVAKILRRHFPGHLFGVMHASRAPKLTRF
jgi:hypothetical protein